MSERLYERLHQAPEEIRSLVLQTPSILRFKDEDLYVEGIFKDNVGLHLIRGNQIIDELLLPGRAKERVRDHWWPHDLPEIETGDVPLIRKELDADLAHDLIQREENVLELIPPKWRDLIREFNRASDLLKGKPVEGKVEPEAVVAKIIDTIDGNMYFHQALSAWVQTDQYAAENIPPEQALTYTFRINRTYQENLGEMALPKEFDNACRVLLKRQLRCVFSAWEEVTAGRIPPVVQASLSWAKKEIGLLQQ